MNEKDHAYLLGQIVTNLLSIELLIRAFLNYHPDTKEAHFNMDDIDNTPVGDEVPKNSLTNYDTLGVLIKKYNKIIRKIDTTLCIDKTVVDIRDFIAHGRLYGKDVTVFPLRMIKFDQPINGKVKIIKKEVLETDWFCTQRRFTGKQIKNVQEALQLVIPPQE